ncbi:MAG: hypothetical protein CL868_12020 [Cytophagaceae bacterium]|nr:hypothetical protein [Cytophagaceae bacterium]
MVWVHLALSQKTLEEVIPVDDIEGILIDTDLVFDVNIQAVAGTDDIQIHTEVEGETFETLLIQTTIEDGILTVHTARSPSFKKIDDKLAAHKLLSVALHLTVPPGLGIEVASSLASVTARGRFNFVNLNLSSGNCFLKDFEGQGIVNTEMGNILVEGHDQKIRATSRNGEVLLDDNMGSGATLILRSIDGNIKVTRSK